MNAGDSLKERDIGHIEDKISMVGWGNMMPDGMFTDDWVHGCEDRLRGLGEEMENEMGR